MQLTAKSDGEQTWEERWVVLTPTTLLVYKSAAKPVLGAAPRTVTYLGDNAAIEIVLEGEVGSHHCIVTVQRKL